MKVKLTFGRLFWMLLYCNFYLLSVAEDDLLDFDFADLKEVDWNYEQDEQLANEQAAADDKRKKIESNMLDFAVEIEDDDAQTNRVPPFDWREKVLRNALAKALTDKALRQKFAEVMPILRLLSSQQRLALSALISAQMNAKQGHELKLDQVRMMFGDDKKLLLPIVYDLANLVKNSARKYIEFGNTLLTSELKKPNIDRNFVLEAEQQDDEVGTIRVGGAGNKPQEDELEDFFADMPADVLDPQKINEGLQAEMQANVKKNDSTTTKSAVNATDALLKRTRRAANEFVHKLIRSMPVSVNEDDLMRGAAGRTIKLNTTAFRQSNQYPQTALPGAAATLTTTGLSSPQTSTTDSTTTTNIPISTDSTQSYAEIENLAFADINGTEFELNPNERLDKLAGNEPLPNPEELIAGPRYRFGNGGNKLHSTRQKLPIKRKRVQTHTRGRGPSGLGPLSPQQVAGSSNTPIITAPRKCERFTASMCIRTDDYPFDQIMGSIRRHKNAMSALLAEFYDKPNNNLDFADEFDDYVVNNKRREDEGSAGGMCQSVVRYARPQKARSASGEWKYIVNTGQHTQTLRLEKCSNPGESCSYLAQTYRSHCSQVYNYHRLLSWDKVRGLHVDIFKVPTCCSCQVDGYRQQFPPLSSIQSKDFTPSSYSPNIHGYSTINEDDLDYNDESGEDDLNFSPAPYNSNSIGHQHPKQAGGHFDDNELFLGSKQVRTKVQAPPTVGAYLSPPDSQEYREPDFGYKQPHRGVGGAGGYVSSSAAPTAVAASQHKKHYSHLLSRRRPHNEPRVDLDLSPSETHTDKEVNFFGTPQPRVPQKRKRIYSAPHTASAGAAAVPPQSTIATSTSAGAANAHQAFTPAATPASDRSYIGLYGSSKSRPRFYAPGSVAATASAPHVSVNSVATTPSTTELYARKQQRHHQHQQHQQQQQQQQSTTLSNAPIYNVNSIFSSSNYNSSHVTAAGAAKRINYNYHPIIDFFDENKQNDGLTTTTEDVTSHETNNESSQGDHVYAHRIPSSSVSSAVPVDVGIGGGTGSANYQQSGNSHERRIGFGAGGLNVGIGVGVGAGDVDRQSYVDDNAWHPVVVAS